MVRPGAVLSLLLALVLAVTVPAGASRGPLPPLVFEDQEGRTLSLASLRGRVAVIVYGTRHSVQESIAWGRRLISERREPADAAPVEIVAVAQMGGIPGKFQGLLRAALRQRTPEGFSLWLDWEDRLSTLFGRDSTAPTVVVADRDGEVQLVVVGRADGAPWDAVTGLLQRLR